MQEHSAYKMSKPVSPTRKTCSTKHHPERKEQKFYQDYLERVHGGDTRMIVFKKSPVRGFTPVELPPEKPDYSAIDYNRSVMYKDILVKKQLKYYRDTKGVYHMGTITE